jgi:hypothetical protein
MLLADPLTLLSLPTIDDVRQQQVSSESQKELLKRRLDPG